MKKILLTACYLVFISNYSKAQLDTIPNAGFENWNYTPFWTIEATGWQTNNSSIASLNVMPDSNSHSGLLGLKIEKTSYRGTIWSGFPVSHHPLTLEGFVKNGLILSDTAIVIIHVYSSNAIVDSGYLEIYGGIGTNYLPFSVNITQNISSADSCVIMIEGGNIFNSTISFDDLFFTFSTSVNENFSDNGLIIFPNPVKNELTIENGKLKIEKVEIFNTLGEKVFQSQLSIIDYRLSIDTSHLSPGAYLLTVDAGKKVSNRIIIKN